MHCIVWGLVCYCVGVLFGYVAHHMSTLNRRRRP